MVFKKVMVLAVLIPFSVLLNSNAIAAGQTKILRDSGQAEIISCSWKPDHQTWRSMKWNLAFDFPVDWQVGHELPDGGIYLKKQGHGYIKLNPIKLPPGETLDKFTRHLISKSKTSDWDIEFSKDIGKRRIGGKTARVLQYRHKKNGRKYTGYNFVAETGKTGVQILMSSTSHKTEKILLGMIESLRFSSEITPRNHHDPAPKTVRIETEDSDITIRGDTITIKTKTTDVQPTLPDASPKRPNDGQKYTVFSEFRNSGNFSGHVFLKDLSKKRMTYPIYIAFYQLEQIQGRRLSKNLDDFKVSGEPVYTSTDTRGNYKIDLEEGKYYAELYSLTGKKYTVVSKKQFVKCSKAKKRHNFKVDNRY
ncbi:MAG: hypothetical protein JRI92_06055 [Deltaproteobacteria bacterium]|nr:hypothetical protein [Deltaproteobacteria bacterium]